MLSFARMARSSCNECGSALIHWTTARDLVFLVPAGLRKRVLEGIQFFGNHAEAWLCSKCSNFGIFGPTEMAL